MGVLDNIFGSSSNPAVPGGSLTKPLVIALLCFTGFALHGQRS
jgi:hypothetical protein